MGIKIKVGGPSDGRTPDKPITDDEQSLFKKSIRLNIRKDLAGNSIIYDHGEIDIVVDHNKLKIITFGKPDKDNSDLTYDAQDRFFRFLIQRGIVDRESVMAGKINGTLEGKYIESSNPKINSRLAVIYTINDFIKIEKPYYIFKKAKAEAEHERYFNPTDEDSTELGEVPQDDFKGNIDPVGYYTGYGYAIYESKTPNMNYRVSLDEQQCRVSVDYNKRVELTERQKELMEEKIKNAIAGIILEFS